MPEVLCLGELLIDFVSMDPQVMLIDAGRFAKKAGGAPANVAAGLARMGKSSGFVGMVGQDPFGDFLEKVLHDETVDTTGLARSSEARTTLAFVAVGPGGVPDFTFYRHPGADMLLGPQHISERLFNGCRWFHFGSISLIDSDPRQATRKACNLAKAKGIIVSYDPNLRMSLWPSPDIAKATIPEGFRFADITKVSLEEWAFVTGTQDFESGAQKLMDLGVQLVVQSMGPEGCRYRYAAGSGQLPGYEVNVVETTGAGDAFMAALIVQLLDVVHTAQEIASVLPKKMEQILDKCNRAGAFTCTGIGAIPSMPQWDQVESFSAKRRV